MAPDPAPPKNEVKKLQIIWHLANEKQIFFSFFFPLRYFTSLGLLFNQIILTLSLVLRPLFLPLFPWDRFQSPETDRLPNPGGKNML